MQFPLLYYKNNVIGTINLVEVGVASTSKLFCLLHKQEQTRVKSGTCSHSNFPDKLIIDTYLQSTYTCMYAVFLHRTCLLAVPVSSLIAVAAESGLDSRNTLEGRIASFNTRTREGVCFRSPRYLQNPKQALNSLRFIYLIYQGACQSYPPMRSRPLSSAGVRA